MAFQCSSSKAPALSAYQHLLRLHQSDDLDSKLDSLNALPESFRQQIFYSIWDQAGRPSDSDYGKIHVFDSLPKLQQTIAKVAANAFQSLDQTEKDKIAWKIWDSAGQPSSEDRNWGENHAADNIPILLKTMHDSLGDLTPELQQILNEWVDQAEPREQRVQARAEIIAFLRKPGKTELVFNYLSLKSLPPVFHAQPFVLRLKGMNLDFNMLSSFPEQFNQLQNLVKLSLDNNQFTSIPEQIYQLQNLKELRLVSNQLTSIPEQICQLQNLVKLSLDNNQLNSIPQQICQLQNLEWLGLSRNRLISIPEQICQLQNLKELYIHDNQLTLIPAQIGQLQNLQRLELNSNRTLQGLPNQLLDLPHQCLIDISMTGLSEQVRANLQQACNVPGYQGPRIYFSMEYIEHMMQLHSAELKPLPILIAELFSTLGEKPREFSQLAQLNAGQKESIRSWLSRLSDTADYKRKGEFQKAFVKQIVGYLQEANDDPQFREAFLNIIADAAITCGDRISLSILHVGIASRLRLIKDIQQLRQFLIGTVWPIQMLEEIARKKTETLSFFDEIEVYLGYPIMLREKLGLEISVQEMLYFRCSALKKSDLDQAAEFVVQQQNDEHAVCAYLSSREDWINALKAQYPERSQAIDEENYQELEAAGEDQDKLNQLEAHQKQRWEALTAWALVETSIITES